MNLDDYRRRIDEIDSRLASLLAERFSVADRIGAYKRENNIPVYNATRENAVAEKVAGIAGEKYGEDVKKVYERIFEVSRGRQQ